MRCEAFEIKDTYGEKWNMYKILVVDDEDKITELLKIYLEMQTRTITLSNHSIPWKLWRVYQPHFEGYMDMIS